MSNYPPKVTYPSLVIFKRHDSTLSTDVTSALGAQVLWLEQRTGAGRDSCLIRFPQKRLQYFEHSDAGYAVSQLDKAYVYMGGKLQLYGRIRTWERQWDGGDEEVSVLVVGNDDFMDQTCQGRQYGRYEFSDNSLRYEVTVADDECIFNRGGVPDYNKARTSQSAKMRFWGSQNKNDSTAGYWNPIAQIMYLVQYNQWTGPNYSAYVNRIGSIASTGGWSDYVSNGDITFQKQYPEMNVDGLALGEALDKVIDQAGGLKVRYNPYTVGGNLSYALTYLRTYPPYAAQQTSVTLYLNSVNSSLTLNNIQRGRIVRDDARRATHVIGFGSPEVYVGTFKLKPGWNQSLTNAVLSNPELINRDPENTEYNPLYADVMRRWILETSNTDLNAICGTTKKFGRDRHRFAPNIGLTYNTGATDEEKRAGLRPLLMFTTDFATNSTLKICDVTPRFLDDIAGVYIEGSGPKLEGSIFRASVPSGTVNSAALFDIFVTAGVISNARIRASVYDAGITANDRPKLQQQLMFGESFRAVKRAPSLGDYSVSGSRRAVIELPNVGLVATTFSSFNSVNDYAGLYRAALDAYKFYNTLYDHGVVMIPWIESSYAIGNVVGSIHDRNIVLNSVIVRRKWDFENQTTELELSDERYRSGVEEIQSWQKNQSAAGYPPGTKSVVADFTGWFA